MRELPSMMDDKLEPNASMALCSECQAGVLHKEYLTYFTWLNDELVTVPNFPAWVCDVCGKREYDGRAINWLNTLLNPDAGRGPAPRRKRRPGKPAVR